MGRLDVMGGAPDGTETAKRLGEMADSLDPATQSVTVASLAEKLEAVGALDNAFELWRAIAAECTKQLGSEHTQTLSAKMNMGNLLKLLGERAAARAHYD